MAKKDLNEIAKYEQAIKDKYGEEAIQNPKKSWNKEKESQYLEELKKIKSNSVRSEKEREKKEGFTFHKKLKTKKQERICPVCQSYSFSVKDDTYMIRYDCCYNCFIQYVEGREERWKSGWRPNN